MSLEYFVGIEFHSRSGEYKSEPSDSASDVFEMARIGNSQKYYHVTIYVKQAGEIFAIPYTKLQHLKDGGMDIEKELQTISRQKNSPTNIF